ncbi:hypothetical protein J3R74_004181 [Puniceicoccus vermicola]|uniref:Curli assembly protein CsgG n=1 Tax=Puniceicoccus vermicola TaxID=388746 RepID=A0A7X1B0F5_9BACT|nr:hypothetical protein [Puniceicoccus vermicola]MBC2603267.1 hypothetical protein [Puniceicoccus vermicola]
MKTRPFLSFFVLLLLAPVARADVSVAVLDFGSSESARDLAEDFGTLFEFALGMQDGILLVERGQLDSALDELARGSSGVVGPEYAGKVGQLTGAQVLVSGKLLKAGDDWVVISKVMGTETMRLFPAKVTFSDEEEIGDAVESLAVQVAAEIRDHRHELLAGSGEDSGSLNALIEMAEGVELPTLRVIIPEVHIGTRVPDPAAQTEVIRVLREIGFTVLDGGSEEEAEVLVTGEAFSEAGLRIRDLVSCRARVEVKAVEEASGNIVFSDAENAAAVDTAEFIAGKSALQRAGGKVAPELAEKLIDLSR